jgi:DNA-binding transcriptional LysR family regulator
MASLEQYRVLVAIMEGGSLTAAARALGCSLQTVSRSLGGLEAELGIELVRRTTRRMQPTAAGLRFYERVKRALRDIDEASGEAMRGTAEIFGLFRVGASVQFAPRYVVPAAAAFIARYPAVEIDLVLSDAVVDLLDSRLDVVVRIGEPGDSSLKSRLLAQLRRVVVAAVSARWQAPCGIRSWTWIQCCREGLYPPYVWTYDLAPYHRSRHTSLVDA